MVKYIGIYIDEKLTLPLNTTHINGEAVYCLTFGNQDVSKNKTYALYLLNESTGDIENLEVTASPITKRDVKLIIEQGKTPKLPMMGVHKFYVSWLWGENVKAGPLEVMIAIKGTVVNELV